MIKATIKFLCVCSLLLRISSMSASGMCADTTGIVAGVTTIKGTIERPEGTESDRISVHVTVLHPISGEVVTHETNTDPTGHFSLNFEIETDTTLISIRSGLNPYKSLLLRSVNGDVTEVHIGYNAASDIAFAEAMPSLNPYDMRNSMEVLGNMVSYRPERDYPHLYKLSPADFLKYTGDVVSERLALFVDRDTSLSKDFKDLLSRELRLFMYAAHVFGYEAQMMLNYRNATQDQSGNPAIHQIDRSYYRFLQDFDLSARSYLQNFSFPQFQNALLQNEILAIPTLGDRAISDWLVDVKAILSDLLGFDDGLYYDILAANAYARQLNEAGKPLTEQQKKAISAYWGEGEIPKILFRKHEQALELNKERSAPVINDMQMVPEAQILDSILAKYPNKVVFVDFWATWCAPCLEAMKQFRTVKGKFSEQDVVFVYLTNGSSPQRVWEEKIQGIGGEHYHLTDAQWRFLMDRFDFEGIPSYLLYDKKGEYVDQFTGFPGNEVVKDKIMELIE